MNKNNIVLTMLLCATVHSTMAHANQGKSIVMSNQPEGKAQQVKQAVYDAHQAMRLDHNEVGIQILQDGLKQYPNEENLLKNLALAFYKNRQYKTATSIYHQLLASNPHNDSILNNYMAALSADSPGNAIEQIKPMQSFYPKNHLIPAQLGVLCSKMGRNSQAIYYYTEAIKIEPKIDYKYNLAVLLDKSNETTGALLLYQDIAKMFSQGFIDNSMYGIPIDSVLARIEYLSKNTQHGAKTKKA